MDFYLVTRIDDWDYDEYDSAVVIAESKDDAIQQIIDTGNPWGTHKYDNLHADKIELIRGIVLESFKAG
jgi:hypothetical protein